MSIKSKIKYWYLGGPLPTQEKISETSKIRRAPNTYKPSLTAKFAQYIKNNIIAILAIIIAASVSLFIHFDNKSEKKEKPDIKIKSKITQNIPQTFPSKIKALTKCSSGIG